MPVRVLAVHQGLLQRRDESAEVEQLVIGLLDAGVAVRCSDGRSIFRAVRHGPGVEYCYEGRLDRARLSEVDVVHVHLPVPLVHLVVALKARCLDIPVVLSPAGMLGPSYARSTWFRGRSGPFRWIKPLLVRLLRAVWDAVAGVTACLGPEESAAVGMHGTEHVIVPWPAPKTWALGSCPLASPETDGVRPLAFVSRLDVNRKGIDRLARWLLQEAEHEPRPTAILFAPYEDLPPGPLEEALRRGLLHWDTVTSGPALQDELRRCRGVALLSRWESFPRSLREAALLGLPTISPPTAQFVEIVKRVGAGAVIDPRDPASIQSAFVQVAGQVGDRAVAASLFDRTSIGRFLAMVFEDLASRRAIRHPDYYRWYDMEHHL